MELDQLLDLLRSECAKAGGQAAWAAKNALSPPYVSDVLNRRREPGASILKALGVAKVVAYRRIPKPSPKPTGKV